MNIIDRRKRPEFSLGFLVKRSAIALFFIAFLAIVAVIIPLMVIVRSAM